MLINSKKLLTKIFLVILPLIQNSYVFAEQIVTGKNGETLTAIVSNTDATMIRVNNHRIIKVFGKTGEFVLTPEKISGNAYILATTKEPYLNLYVLDDANTTFHLILQPKAGPVDSITIVDSKYQIKSGVQKKTHIDYKRDEQIKKIIMELSLSNEDAKDSEDVIQTYNEEIPLWKEARFELNRKIDTDTWVGERYYLTNVSNKPMRIDERELYKKGVAAILVSKPYLLSGENTIIYIVSQKVGE